MTRSRFQAARAVTSLLVTNIIYRARASNAVTAANCSLHASLYTGNDSDKTQTFDINSWVHRGICVRSEGIQRGCYESLNALLKQLDELRKGEYTGAASVLALLPTIGALLGAPTSEIWRLLTVVPFGGGLAMTLSFGSAILPVRIEDYENDLNKSKIAVDRTYGPLGRVASQIELAKREDDAAMDLIIDRILLRMRQPESLQMPKGHLIFGLIGMIVISLGAQAAMIVIEQGGVIPWLCTARYWMHLWYFLVTFTAIMENWAQYPFSASWKLFVSDVPYDVTIHGGDSIMPQIDLPFTKSRQVLRQLRSLKAGTAVIRGSMQKTKPRNTVMVMVSVASSSANRKRSTLRLFSKICSITTFVLGTAFFASVQLLALPVAVMTLTLILAAAVLNRAITGWIVDGVSKTEPLIHAVVNTKREAQRVMGRILSLDRYDSQVAGAKEIRKIQVELGGHVFVDQRRVGQRSTLYLRLLGVLAEPFDLRSVHHSDLKNKIIQSDSESSEVESGYLMQSGQDRPEGGHVENV